jgi:hypothetical protein
MPFLSLKFDQHVRPITDYERLSPLSGDISWFTHYNTQEVVVFCVMTSCSDVTGPHMAVRTLNVAINEEIN